MRGLPRAQAVDASGRVACAVTVDGELWCWGGFVCGGRASMVADCVVPDHRVHRPVRVDGLPEVTAAEIHAIEGSAPGDVGAAPRLVAGLEAVEQIALGSAFACVLIEGGTVRCWGQNGSGQLGDGTLVDREPPGVEPSL